MRNKRILALLSILIITSLALVGCGEKEAANPMKYVSVEDVKEDIDAGGDGYVLLDVRQEESYNEGHIKGAYLADVHEANKNGDDESGIKNLKEGLKNATGNETGNADDKYVLICYSGKSYAQKATDLLIEMGLSPDQIFTLEGGMKAWEEGGEDYTNLLE